MTETENEKIFAKIVEDVTKNHRKIINDWCQAYLAQLVEEGIEIKPDCFTLFHKQPAPLEGNLVHEYWFELREKKVSNRDKFLKLVMSQIAKLIEHIEDRLKELRGQPDHASAIPVLLEIRNFLHFVDKDE